MILDLDQYSLLNSVFYDTPKKKSTNKLYYITWGDKIFRNKNAHNKWTYHSPKVARNILIEFLANNVTKHSNFYAEDDCWHSRDHTKIKENITEFVQHLEDVGEIQIKELADLNI